MELQVGVKALLKNKEGKYLLLKKSKKKYPSMRGWWDMPGGRIDPGTSLFENLKREIKEETNLDLRKEPKLIAAQDILHMPGKHVIRLTYIGTIDPSAGSGLVIDTSEIEEYAWLTLEEIKNHEDLDIFLQELLEKGLLRI
jgi:ADP-ribose pyrophosphatase YjhB (NUDIX family)